MPSFYQVAHCLVARVALWMFRVRIEGAENLPSEGGYLYCSNHICFLDPVLVCGAGRTQVHYMAKKELFQIPVLAPLIRALGAYPVVRGSGDVSAIRKSIALLEKKESIGIFIQGHRYRGVDLRETKPKNGVVLISARSGAPILPICIKMKKNTYAPFRRIHLIIGKPIPAEALGVNADAPGNLTEASQRVFDEICALGDTVNG